MFSALDNTKSPDLLYLSSMGIAATKGSINGISSKTEKIEAAIDAESSGDDNPEDG